jgi:hypothetical protein
MPSKNNETLQSFVKYCQEHPEERFWQALRNWSKYAFIYGSNSLLEDERVEDTFYIENTMPKRQEEAKDILYECDECGYQEEIAPYIIIRTYDCPRCRAETKFTKV